MPLEFISENVYNGGTFELFLQRLQSNYGTIISLTQAFQDKFGTVFPNLETYLVKDNVDSLSHSFARCYTTREILKNLFGMDRWYRNPNLPSDDAIFRVVNIGGKLFPDHTFVIIQYKESVYLLQSYYYGYLLSGKYGVIKLLGDSFIELDNILEGYKNPNLQEYEIEALNRRFSFFTGIESSRHWGDLFGFKINCSL